jgi:hypothetical protein
MNYVMSIRLYPNGTVVINRRKSGGRAYVPSCFSTRRMEHVIYNLRFRNVQVCSDICKTYYL